MSILPMTFFVCWPGFRCCSRDYCWCLLFLFLPPLVAPFSSCSFFLQSDSSVGSPPSVQRGGVLRNTASLHTKTWQELGLPTQFALHFFLRRIHRRAQSYFRLHLRLHTRGPPLVAVSRSPSLCVEQLGKNPHVAPSHVVHCFHFCSIL